MESLWRKQTGKLTSKQNATQETAEKTHFDVIVVGAGMAGLLIAYYLKERGKDVLVLEAGEIASGQTERTTAKITSQHGLKYSQLMRTVGVKKARLYAQANEAAIREYEQLIQRKGIACDFERVPAYLYTREQEELLREEATAAATLGIDAFLTRKTELPFPVEAAVCFPNQAQFSPLKFVRQIASELEIREHTKVTAVKGKKVFAEDKVMTAEQIIIAAHYPFKNVPGFYFLRQHQERSYVLALSGWKQSCKRAATLTCEEAQASEELEINGMYYGIDKDGHSFRRAGEYLLLGGSSRRTGDKRGGAYDALLQAAREYFPGCREEMRWSAQDCMPHDGIPFIGKYSIFTPHLYVATGFQKWGMNISMIAAQILRDEICGSKNPYAKLFSPQRFHIRASMKNLMVDVGESVKGLTKGLFHKTARCPHMGCELVWNPDEDSWDCPCHGSRFEDNGKLLDNPAVRDKKRKTIL